jgi:hypothetical protein
VTLWWQALGTTDRDYSVFVHLTDAEGHLWAQQDRLLQPRQDSASTWAVGVTVSDDYELRLPPNVPPGVYSLKTGIYYWETAERLPVSDLNGRSLASDALPLGSVTVIG